MRCPFVLATLMLCSLAVPREARAWSPAMHHDVVDHAGRLMPASLQRVLAENIGRLHAGAAAPLASNDAGYLRAGQPGSRGTLEETIQLQVQRVLDLLGSRAPMSNVAYEMGVLSHYVALANTPAVAGNSDVREADWADAFERFTESRVPRFRLVFDGYWSPSLGKDDVRGFVQECRVRSGRHYDVLSMMYVKADGTIASNDFDDRSPVFGVASLAYAHAIGDTAKIWLYTWIRANGDTTGLPFPQALQVGPAVEGPR
jgi:hypothetical protein